MDTVQSLEDLMRAASAAGYAMAGADDDIADTDTPAVQTRWVAAEDRGRGVRMPVGQSSAGQSSAGRTAAQALALMGPTAPVAKPRAAPAATHSMRDTVYNYLGLGVPA